MIGESNWVFLVNEKEINNPEFWILLQGLSAFHVYVFSKEKLSSKYLSILELYCRIKTLKSCGWINMAECCAVEYILCNELDKHNIGSINTRAQETKR